MRWLFCSSTFDSRTNFTPRNSTPEQQKSAQLGSSSSIPSTDNEADNRSSTTSPHRHPFPLIRPAGADKRDQPWPSSEQQFDSIISPLDLHRFSEPDTLVSAAVLATAALAAIRFYRTFLRRIPNAKHIPPKAFRRRVLLGRVTSVGDGDNFHMYHTPGGRFAGWDWLRKVPTAKKELRQGTIHVRLAGIDAPELAHFGRPAMKYSQEALAWLTNFLMHRRVWVHLYREDQYSRVVGTAYVRRWLFFRQDVGLQMLREGMATVYDAKTGVEFGGSEMEKKYRATEAWARRLRKGLWKDEKTWWGKEKADWETPREYKTRMAERESGKDKDSGNGDSKSASSTSSKK